MSKNSTHSVWDLDLPVMGDVRSDYDSFGSQTEMVGLMLAESARWLRLSWVQDKLEERWAALVSQQREPFEL